MWIIPKNLPTYLSVQDTKGLVEDSEEFSQMSEKSLMWRSKPSQSQTWSRRWKRMSYIRHLSIRTLKLSHSQSFVESWTSLVQDFHVNLSLPLVAELPQKILDIYIPTSLEESQSADQLMLFLKMSKGLSVVKQPMASRYSSMSSEIWKKEVIKQRGLWSQRVKLALHTSGREFLSWPTARLSDGEGGRIETVLNKTGFKSKRKASNQFFGAKLRDAVETYENWPTADATNISDGVPWEISGKQLEERRARVKKAVKEGKTKAGSGRSVNLAMAVQREMSWSTPNTMDHLPPKEREAMERIYETHRKGEKSCLKIGLQDQNKSNIDGKNQESWGTPKEQDSRAAMSDRKKSNLGEQAQNKTGKKLNPNWVEQLMGLPVGWTQLPTEWTD